jgi:hypothetical protein
MRRTQAWQVDPITTLDETPCRVCGKTGIAIIALGTNENGAIERAYCGVACAITQGWPWVRSERARDQTQRQASLFMPDRDP